MHRPMYSVYIFLFMRAGSTRRCRAASFPRACVQLRPLMVLIGGPTLGFTHKSESCRILCAIVASVTMTCVFSVLGVQSYRHFQLQ